MLDDVCGRENTAYERWGGKPRPVAYSHFEYISDSVAEVQAYG